VAASKRRLTSHDGVLPADPDPPNLGRAPPPSYLGVSRCVGGYSTFTSYAADRRAPAAEGPATATVGDEAGSSGVPKGGQQCLVTLVDDVVAGVTTLNGGIVNGGDCCHHCRSDDARDVVDGPLPDCQTGSTTVKVLLLLLL